MGDPDSGKLTREKWHAEERTELRNLSAELWAAVRKHMGQPAGQSSSAGRPPPVLFGGLLHL